MKLLSPGFVLTALAACATAAGDSNDRTALNRRQGDSRGILAGTYGALDRRQGLLDLAGQDEESAGNRPPAANQQEDNKDAESPTPDSNDDTKPASDAEPAETSTHRPSSTTSSSSSPDNEDKTDDKDSEEPASSKSDDADSSTSSSKPSPTGESCSKDGEKRCATSGNGYQECQDGVWSDQSCGGSDVCGKDEDGGVACMDKDQATVSRESCSNKDEQRCDASDDTKYQTCDGKYWQTFSCENSQCNMDGDKVICGDANGGDGGGISYTMHEPTAFVPETTSIAPPMRAAFGTAAVAFVLAAALSSVGI
ncbi:hypothetical protein H4R20_003968 [Coemansia guatemalensis]|uniref:Uncharacterized protein n=1 Tax=Coemansia guatemalensis TaxID=2761395 RepID=A0A9W8HSB9_9FUNG|nr:hypothetical protein H4R20_003968 [Coemansia guatemalensis]